MEIVMPFGLVGLGELREFVLMPIEGSWPFLYFRSQGALELEFLVVEARNIIENYEFQISDQDVQSLGLEDQEEALVLNIVTVHSVRPQYVTANLAGPVLINRRTLMGRQVVITQSEKYSTTHALIDERQPVRKTA